MTLVPFSRDEVVGQLEALGVETGGVLLVHTSFRAVRPVEGGVEGLIGALRQAVGPEGTVVMPSWSGCDDEPFLADRTPVDASLGAVSQLFWRLPGVSRSTHPHAFAAVGPHAAQVLQDGLPLPPHRPESPVGRVRDLDGQVLLLGVDQTANTTIHLAELLASVPYRTARSCTVAGPDGPRRIEYLENDHCCERFGVVDDWLHAQGLRTQGQVGHATSTLMRSRAVVDVVVERLSREPLFFLHEKDDGCAECNAARASAVGGVA